MGFFPAGSETVPTSVVFACPSHLACWHSRFTHGRPPSLPLNAGVVSLLVWSSNPSETPLAHPAIISTITVQRHFIRVDLRSAVLSVSGHIAREVIPYLHK